MKLLFAHDHIFRRYNEEIYSSQYPCGIWSRYLKYFSSVCVVARVSDSSVEPTLPKSKVDNVQFIFFENISSVNSLFGRRADIKRKISEIILKYDAVVVRLPSEFGLLVADVARSLGVKYYVEVVGCAWDALWNYGGGVAKTYAPVLYMRTKKAVYNASGALYVTDKFLQNRYSVKNNALSLAVSDVDIDIFDEDVIKNRIKTLGEGGKKVVFGTIGSLKTRYKGVSYAIDACELLKNKGIEFEYRVLGSGDLDSYIKMVEQKGLRNEFLFDGVLAPGREVMRWIDGVDIYVQPSLTEGLPRALIEAMSRGCPAIGSRVGGIPDILDEKYTFQAGNSLALYNKMLEMMDNREELPSQIVNNFNRAKNFSRSELEKRRDMFYGEICR